MIEKNYIFIYHTLRTLSENKNLTNWAWSRGGFEHRLFNTVNEWDFSAWQDKHCDINLWDHYDNTLARPFYHVTDNAIKQSICDTYINMLNL